MNLSTDDASFLVYEALASKPRLKMLQLLSERDLNVKELAAALGFSPATTTVHVKKLEDAGLISHRSVPAKHGQQKICSLIVDSFHAAFRETQKRQSSANHYHVSMPVGHFTDYSVHPTCGMASTRSLIGHVDDPRYFSDPDHYLAAILWFGSGYVEYRIPNYMLVSQVLMSIDISLEICSEAPGYNEQWPSDIAFSLNGRMIGMWTSPGDFGANHGVRTPPWWRTGTQHGLWKSIHINGAGSFVDGIQVSDVTVAELNVHRGEDVRFRVEVSDTATHVGGVTLFGRGFGNYDQDIEVYFNYVKSVR